MVVGRGTRTVPVSPVRPDKGTIGRTLRLCGSSVSGRQSSLLGIAYYSPWRTPKWP